MIIIMMSILKQVKVLFSDVGFELFTPNANNGAALSLRESEFSIMELLLLMGKGTTGFQLVTGTAYPRWRRMYNNKSGKEEEK